MPFCIYEKVGLGQLNPTRMSLKLADCSVEFPVGIVEDAPIKVGKFFILPDFAILEMDEDRKVPIIL